MGVQTITKYLTVLGMEIKRSCLSIAPLRINWVHSRFQRIALLYYGKDRKREILTPHTVFFFGGTDTGNPARLSLDVGGSSVPRCCVSSARKTTSN